MGMPPDRLKPPPNIHPSDASIDGNCNPLARPNTLLIDSEQLEAGDALDDKFRGMGAVT